MKKLLPILFIVLAVLVLLRGVMPQKVISSFPVSDFGSLPVLEGGRYKPMDSLARTSLLLMRGTQYTKDLSGKKMGASEWLMHLTLYPEASGGFEVFRIDHESVKTLIQCSDFKRKYFSYSEIIAHAQAIEETLPNIPQEAAMQNAGQKETLKLYSNLRLYRRLAYALRIPLMQATVEGEYLRFFDVLERSADKLQENPDGDPEDEDLKLLSRYARTFGSLSDRKSIKFVPFDHGEMKWLNLSEALMMGIQFGQIPETAILYAQLSDAFISADIQKFEGILLQIKNKFNAASMNYSPEKVQAEAVVNSMQLFATSMSLYVFGLIIVFVAWLFLDQRLLTVFFWVLLTAFLIHSGGMVARMIIQGRPPVTNLYSSAVFVGWGSAALGLVLERFFKNGIGGCVACMVGFLSLIIANHLMASGDTMEMMRAVLDSNFWLATHVITVSLGYSSTYIAGFLAILYLILGVFTRVLDQATEKNLLRMVYGIVCFALLFSFVGTVLGGIWADQSWGRFWGWDPKENGALMIVIWNALILHAKRGGVVKNVGFMNLAIFGNIITSWSWFGTNMLGVGLHSYGFMSSAFFWLVLFCTSQILIMLLGFVPRNKWLSKRN